MCLGDLSMNNLGYTARLPDWERPILFGHRKNFFYLFIFRLFVLVYCPSSYITLWVLLVVPEFQELAKQTYFFSWSQGIRLKDLRSNGLPPFH